MNEQSTENKVIDTKAVIEEQFGRFLVQGKRYPAKISDVSAMWYCYTRAYGHTIAVALKSRFTLYQSPLSLLELALVKTVLRGYDVVGGYIVIDMSYTSPSGLRVPLGDREW